MTDNDSQRIVAEEYAATDPRWTDLPVTRHTKIEGYRSTFRHEPSWTPMFGIERDTDDWNRSSAEPCYRPGCSGWITGASDYCSMACEEACDL